MIIQILLWSHTMSTLDIPLSEVIQKKINTSDRGPCYAFQEGNCSRGQSCRFAHGRVDSSRSIEGGAFEGERKKAMKEKKEKKEIWCLCCLFVFCVGLPFIPKFICRENQTKKESRWDSEYRMLCLRWAWTFRQRLCHSAWRSRHRGDVPRLWLGGAFCARLPW